MHRPARDGSVAPKDIENPETDIAHFGRELGLAPPEDAFLTIVSPR